MLVMDGLELHLYPRMTLNFDHFPSTPQVLVPQVCALVTGLFGMGIGTRASCMLGKHCHLPCISSKAFHPSFNPVASKRTMDVTFGARWMSLLVQARLGPQGMTMTLEVSGSQ